MRFTQTSITEDCDLQAILLILCAHTYMGLYHSSWLIKPYQQCVSIAEYNITFKHSMPSLTHPHFPPEYHVFHLILFSSWSDPLLPDLGEQDSHHFECHHSTQDGSITATQPADSDTSHTLTSLQPCTTYRIEVWAVRKGEGADGQRELHYRWSRYILLIEVTS